MIEPVITYMRHWVHSPGLTRLLLSESINKGVTKMFYDLTKIKALLAYHFCYPLPFAFLRSEAFLEQFMFGFTVHSDKKFYE